MQNLKSGTFKQLNISTFMTDGNAHTSTVHYHLYYNMRHGFNMAI